MKEKGYRLRFPLMALGIRHTADQRGRNLVVARQPSGSGRPLVDDDPGQSEFGGDLRGQRASPTCSLRTYYGSGGAGLAYHSSFYLPLALLHLSLALQVVGVVGALLHINANLITGGTVVPERFIWGAPFLAAAVLQHGSAGADQLA